MSEEMQELIDRLEALAVEMKSVSGLMVFLGGGGGDDEMVSHAGELLGASGVAMQWADQLRKANNETVT